MSFLRYADRVYNAPLLVTSEKARIIEQVFRAHEDGGARALPMRTAPVDGKAHDVRRELSIPGMTRAAAGYLRGANGIAIVEMVGEFVQRSGDEQLDAMSGLVAYSSLSQRMMAAADDPRVDGILMYVDSNGGEVPGIIDYVATINAVKKKKTVWAMADERALSAGMWVASAATQLFVAQTGMVGSIGVRMLHVDQSARDAKQGVVYTEIVAGERKAEFSPHAPLSEEARAWAQARVDEIYSLFVAAVAEHRGIDPQAIRDTQAALLNPAEALALGLVDGVMGLDATLAALSAELDYARVHGPRARAQLSTGAEDMTTKDDKQTPAAGAVTAEQITEAQARGFAEGKAEGTRIGSEAERARVAGILTHAEATDRRTLAEHLAFKTDSSIDAAGTILAAAPKATPAATGNRFAAAMGNVPNPDVAAGADANDDGGPNETAKAVAFITNAGKAPKLSAVK